jgi:hypothetical protein
MTFTAPSVRQIKWSRVSGSAVTRGDEETAFSSSVLMGTSSLSCTVPTSPRVCLTEGCQVTQ